MRIKLIQSPIVWENAAENRLRFEKQIGRESADLIVLPEMFSTGFSMQPKAIAEKMDGPTVLWMIQIAIQNNCAVTGSMIIEEKGNFYNRLLFVDPTGKIESYDKRHLFSLSGEDKVYSRGNKKLIVEYRNWRICLLICYDLRFPVFSRNTQDYDLLIYVANWPLKRINAWDILLKARAVENQCYVVGVNRIGEDDNGILYSGHSQVIDAVGNCILGPLTNAITQVVSISKEHILKTRKNLNFLADRDEFTVH